MSFEKIRAQRIKPMLKKSNALTRINQFLNEKYGENTGFTKENGNPDVTRLENTDYLIVSGFQSNYE